MCVIWHEVGLSYLRAFVSKNLTTAHLIIYFKNNGIGTFSLRKEKPDNILLAESSFSLFSKENDF